MTTIELAPQQRVALASVQAWLDAPEGRPVFKLFGYAGTGKTTLAIDLVQEVEGTILFAAFTGKAAFVMQSKGCLGAQTIHSLIYKPRIKSANALAELQEELRTSTDPDRIRELRRLADRERDALRKPAFSLNLDSPLRGAALLVLDEVSMVGAAIAQDLLGFGCPILALGDPAQLPPVGDGGYFTNGEPDAMLTEVHRQAQDSPVLHLATQIRQGQTPAYGDYGSSRVVAKGVLDIGALAAHDQIICGKNVTRHAVNRMVREHLGRQGVIPETGDRVVCRRNDRDTGLLNGSQWQVQSCEILNEDRMFLTIRGLEADSYSFQVEAHRAYFEDRADSVAHWEIREAQHFEYAYVVTAHTAQGSQWNSVAVIDQSSSFRQDAARWLYTAVTRAAEKVTVIR